jgi:glycosyltransferase involved in cell wall biosynthesis
MESSVSSSSPIHYKADWKMVSFVVPAFNESNGIAKVVNELKEAMYTLNKRYEILLVDDGSTDSTLQKAKKLEKMHNGIVKVLSYSKNRGKGFALKYGFENSKGELIFFIDADGDLPPKQIDRFFEIMSKSGADVVIGSKRHPNSMVVNYPTGRKMLSQAYFLLTKALFNLNVRDTQVGLKLFKREVLEQVMPKILVKRYAFDVELLANAVRRGYRIVEAPVKLTFNNDSRINWKAICDMFVDTLAIAYRMHILKYYDR